MNKRFSEAMAMVELLVKIHTPEEKQAGILRAVKDQMMLAFSAGMAEEHALAFQHPMSEHVTRIGGYGYDSLGGVWVTHFIVEAPDTNTVYERLADIGIKAEHCQHEYDCCGHWYGDSPKILQTLNSHSEYLVEWRQHQNV